MESIIHLHPEDEVVASIQRINAETVYLSIKREHKTTEEIYTIVEEFTVFGSMLQLRYIVDQLAQQIEAVPEKTLSEELGL